MNEHRKSQFDTLGPRVAEALRKNNFDAEYVSSGQQALTRLLELIPSQASVGMGGSWTLGELDVHAKLEARGHQLFNHNQPGLSPEKVLAFRRAQLTADVFLSGANAITLDGKIVNVDGIGNRVAAMIFGPQKVIIVAGANKIVKDVAEAESRIAMIAAPVNCKRMNKGTPCVKTGVCMDCSSPERICNVTTILRKRPWLTEMHVIIVGEELGF